MSAKTGTVSKDLNEYVEFLRLDATRRLDTDQRNRLGQYLTPAPIAKMMASLLQAPDSHVSILEPGAGVGSLVAAAVDSLVNRDEPPVQISVTAFEIDADLIEYLTSTFEACEDVCSEAGIEFESHTIDADFLEETVERFAHDLFGIHGRPEFDVVIMNPPYRKIRSDSRHRALLRRLHVETSNLYTGFLASATEYLRQGGEMVAITPRSFCNGPYFRPFREVFLERMALQYIHVFESRATAFRDDEVLQENIIFRAIRGAEPGSVTVSSSAAPRSPASRREIDYQQLVWPGDPNSFIHIVPDESGQLIANAMSRLAGTLQDLGLEVSTGRVVDFRASEYLRAEPGLDTAPLIYPSHMRSGSVEWPKQGKKPNAIKIAPQTADLLVPRGHYVLVKRFTAKEERRRVVAVVYDAQRNPAPEVGFENHLNYYHENGHGLTMSCARGLAAYLNSTLVDSFFRHFSGHTQVNATDLRALPYPSLSQLEDLSGTLGDETPSQTELDRLIDQVFLALITGGGSPVQMAMRIREAQSILDALGLPAEQTNERSALTFLGLLNVRPDTPWAEAEDPLRRIHDLLEFISDHYGVRYAENTRETVRRRTIHQFQEAGVVIRNPDDPTRAVNSPRTVYQVSPPLLALVRTYGTAEWEGSLEGYLAEAGKLRDRYAKVREVERIPILIDGDEVRLSPGQHSALIAAIVEEFAPRFAPEGRLIYVGDTEAKFAHYDEDGLTELGVEIDEHGKIPDVVVHRPDRNWLFLVEAVTSHGPVNPMRRDHLSELFSDSHAELVYVTAFTDRAEMARHIGDLSWETEVWVADAPGHLIHFDGERFLGPYEY